MGLLSGNRTRKEKVVAMPRRVLVVILAALVVGGAAGLAWFLFRPVPAEAGLASDFEEQSVSDLAAYVQGPAAIGLRLMALEALRKKTDSGVDDALTTIARGQDLRIAIHASTALGKQKSSSSKSALRDLVTDDKLDSAVRMAAMTAIAVHWKDADDLEWLESKAGTDSRLSGHAVWLKTAIYGK